MHIHNVYFWLDESLTDDDIRAFEAGLRSLTEASDVQTGHYGKPASTEVRDVVDNSYSYGLVLCFDDSDAHDRYQISNTHQAFVDGHSARWTRVTVYDFQT